MSDHHTHSRVIHAYENAIGTVPIVELELDWGTWDPWSTEGYLHLTIKSLTLYTEKGWPVIRVIGPMESLAEWLLNEYTDGDAAAAYHLLYHAKVPPTMRIIEQA